VFDDRERHHLTLGYQTIVYYDMNGPTAPGIPV